MAFCVVESMKESKITIRKARELILANGFTQSEMVDALRFNCIKIDKDVMVNKRALKNIMNIEVE
jgi:hypothetical protein